MRQQLEAEIARLEAEHEKFRAPYKAALERVAKAQAEANEIAERAAPTAQALGEARKALQAILPKMPRVVEGSGNVAAAAAGAAAAQ